MQKVTHWAELAEAHPGVLMLCSDNDISLLPGWLERLTEAFDAAGGLDLCFQREGGDDPFFEARRRTRDVPAYAPRQAHPEPVRRRSHTTQASFCSAARCGSVHFGARWRDEPSASGRRWA